MSTLLEKLKSLGLSVSPDFNVGVVRFGPEWFIGKEMDLPGGGHVQLAWFGDFRDKKKSGEWRSELIEELSAEDRTHIDAQIKDALQAERGARTSFWQAVAQQAKELWALGTDRGRHAYLDQKKLSGLHGTRIMMNEAGHPVLLVPMRDAHDQLWNITRIFTKKFTDPVTGQERGNKFTLKGGRKEGTFHRLGNPYHKDTVYICEGFATGASIQEALPDANVIVCFDAGNILPVAKTLRSREPSLKFIFCADDDRWKPQYGNAGVNACQRAKEELGGEIRVPRFKDDSSKPTDWNDLHVLEGLATVADQLMNPPKELPVETPSPKKISEARIVAELVESYGDTLLKQDRDVFHWSDTKQQWDWYPPRQAQDHFLKVIDAVAGHSIKFKDLMSIYNRFMMQVPHAPKGVNLFAPPPFVTNFRNGALELQPQEDGTFRIEFREKRKLDLLCYSHPFDYNVEAPYNTEFEETVARVLPPEAIDTYYEILGACLVPAFPKVVLFIGPPGSGKSTLILFAYQLVDPALRCSVDPSDWRGFGMETMAGKLVNVNPDIALARPIAENLLKQIEDRVPLRIQRKGLTDIYAPMPAIHLFGGNGLPKTVESVEAFTRRVMIVKADRYRAPETGFIRDFANHIWKKNPQGVIRRALEGAARLAMNKGHFTSFDAAKKEMEDWKNSTADYVEQFLEDLKDGAVEIADGNTKVMLVEKAKMTRDQFWAAFSKWFEIVAPRRISPTQKEVYRRLRELGIKDTKSGNFRYFEGFSVKETPQSAF